eukprot:16447667-Heterocapsa_arctica.AAC.1
MDADDRLRLSVTGVTEKAHSNLIGNAMDPESVRAAAYALMVGPTEEAMIALPGGKSVVDSGCTHGVGG